MRFNGPSVLDGTNSIRQPYLGFISRDTASSGAPARAQTSPFSEDSSVRARITVDQSTFTIHPSFGSYLRCARGPSVMLSISQYRDVIYPGREEISLQRGRRNFNH